MYQLILINCTLIDPFFSLSCRSAFCLVDEQKTCMLVTVYNLAKGRGVTVGDSVGIPEPFVIQQKFSYMNNVSFTYICMYVSLSFSIVLVCVTPCYITSKRGHGDNMCTMLHAFII